MRRGEPVLLASSIKHLSWSETLQRRLVMFCIFAFTIAVTAAAQDSILAPDRTLVAADGHSVTLSQEVKKQTAILLFWATWCPYCKARMAQLQSVRLEFGPELEILAIDIQEDGDPVAFLDQAAYDFTLLPDGDAVADLYGVSGTPAVFIVDRQQHLRFDLRQLPGVKMPESGKPATNGSKAAYLAPYWAAEIRKGLDQALNDR
jgi:thiol-disulfide isomerase/thioredoxin